MYYTSQANTNPSNAENQVIYLGICRARVVPIASVDQPVFFLDKPVANPQI